jgi:methyltransferase (TIGR00027 family)
MVKNSQVNRTRPSKMAEEVTMHRVGESSKPEDERICYDPLAKYFINPETLEYATKHPEKAFGVMERHVPGLRNSLLARVKYFDDYLEECIKANLEQIVILGAGYDTRAYRIKGIKNIKVFEVDHPNTQNYKIQKIKEIYSSTPEHVTYVPIDFETQKLSQELYNNGYNKLLKILFIIEGLIYYIPPKAAAETLTFIAKNTGKGSSVIFDYFPESVVNGQNKTEIAQNLRIFPQLQGEPLQFGINEEDIEKYLTRFGFTHINNISTDEYKKTYFHGKNKKRNVCNLLYFVTATIN